jgi:hypothetical protein
VDAELTVFALRPAAAVSAGLRALAFTTLGLLSIMRTDLRSLAILALGSDAIV